jgi:hypothetical protein
MVTWGEMGRPVAFIRSVYDGDVLCIRRAMPSAAGRAGAARRLTERKSMPSKRGGLPLLRAGRQEGK